MQAIVVDRFGGPEVLQVRDVPAPAPATGEVLLDVEAAGVLWIDTAIRRGDAPHAHRAVPPYVPGGTVAGTVTGLGAGVGPDLLGRRVVARAPAGGYAERVAVRTDELTAVPDGLDLPSAAALAGDGAVALALLERTPVRPGEHVLVLPAAGAAGSLLVQLVTAAGGRVIGGARGTARQDLVRALGAEHVVGHSAARNHSAGGPHGDQGTCAARGWMAEVHALVPRGLDVVFDGVGGDVGRSAAWLVADGGRYSSYGTADGRPVVVGSAETRSRRLTVAGIDQLAGFAAERPRRVREVLARASRGELRAVVGATYSLAEAAHAHADLEQRRATGKILLRP
ncbi:zinc-binding dehydrogenase [Pseudonocardia nematodicida]|uniref:Zinc-binding dehydrogenase n=1 Tax=Pseudonocardia nematodicida TaxID=1206997 RepID=A0ABV1KGY7_9PSEU